MTRVKLNLASGSVQEREVVTAFSSDGIKYIIFDGESTGSMGLPIILVSKEALGKVVGITDAEEWKNTKECLKKIISGEKVDYAAVPGDLNADDIYYRQLTLPIASFDILKSSYVAPDESSSTPAVDQTPIFEQITPEDIAGTVPNVEPVAPSVFNETIPDMPFKPEVAASENEVAPVINSEPIVGEEPSINSDLTVPESTNNEVSSQEVQSNNYEELKKEFMTAAEELFNNIYNKLNHED